MTIAGSSRRLFALLFCVRESHRTSNSILPSAVDYARPHLQYCSTTTTYCCRLSTISPTTSRHVAAAPSRATVVIGEKPYSKVPFSLSREVTCTVCMSHRHIWVAYLRQNASTVHVPPFPRAPSTPARPAQMSPTYGSSTFGWFCRPEQQHPVADRNTSTFVSHGSRSY